MRVLLALGVVCFALGVIAKAPCSTKDWQVTDAQRYSQMCYSDIPYLYTGRGLAERQLPYVDAEPGQAERYQAMEYPVLIGYFAYANAVLTHGLSDWPDVEQRQLLPSSEIYSADGVPEELGTYFDVTAVTLAVAALLAVWFLAGAHPGRPWDALGYVISPALLLTGLINWDYLVVAAVAAFLWCIPRQKWWLAGVCVGLGTAIKLYPLFLLGALLALAWRHRRYRPFLQATGAAALTWLLCNLPAILTGWEQWSYFWTFNSDRGADLGSIWLVLDQLGMTASAHTINLVSYGFFAACCLGVLVLALRSPQSPRVAQLGFLIVLAFLFINKVYSPQYVMWLLPLAVMARPHKRDLAIWQVGELCYFAAVWWYLGGFLTPSGGGDAVLYWVAIVLRMSAQVYFAAQVIADLRHPERDVVTGPFGYSGEPTRSASKTMSSKVVAV